MTMIQNLQTIQSKIALMFGCQSYLCAYRPPKSAKKLVSVRPAEEDIIEIDTLMEELI
jgi:hypothetical protein